MTNINSFLSKRMNRTRPSPTLAMTMLVAQLRASGRDIIDLALGEPDQGTPSVAQKAGIEAIQKGQTRYTPVDGMRTLKEAVIEKFKRDNGLTFALDQVIATAGGKQAIANAFMATLSEGDEVIIPSPYWVSYPDMVRMADGEPVFIQTTKEDGFKLSPEALEAAITPLTKWVVLNAPNNPTGAVYTKDELKALASVLEANPQVLVLSDDVYESIVYDDCSFGTIAQVASSALAERILIVNAVSKTHSMTGWRLGFAAGPSWLIKAMAKVQGQMTGNPCSISQVAATAALSRKAEDIRAETALYQKRRDRMVGHLNRIAGFSCPIPQGAFYVFPNCQGLIGAQTKTGETLRTDEDVAKYLLEQGGVALMHGSAFGGAGHLRLSFADSEDIIAQACDRIEGAVRDLRLPKVSS